MWEAAGMEPVRSYEKLREKFQQGLPNREQLLCAWELVHMAREDRNQPPKSFKTAPCLISKLRKALSNWRRRLEHRERHRQRCYWHRLRERLKVLKARGKWAERSSETVTWSAPRLGHSLPESAWVHVLLWCGLEAFPGKRFEVQGNIREALQSCETF